MTKKLLVLGIGNTIRGDDGIGIHVTTALRKNFEPRAACVCTEEMGLSLLDHLTGFEEAIIIDSISTKEKEEGTVHLFSLADFSPHGGRSNHYTGLPEVAVLAEKLGIPFPKKVYVIGIEVADPYEINTSLSPSMQKRFPDILKKVEELVREITNATVCTAP